MAVPIGYGNAVKRKQLLSGLAASVRVVRPHKPPETVDALDHSPIFNQTPPAVH